ncbi:MAG: hypothetical protein A2W98_05860 [Bacteroidetes bacterium GWF2_33_38]|nr:MAG: hypothetical protein A2W98_05860 [Bacteroidetes bacterium GWF2_33_38]OFY92154.1 MAG: hypothetical protein A2236_07535 [Bacteroidetes bacterium RIFOXYA2_FULL_33_7]
MRYIILLILSILIFSNAYSTHNRAGEITYRQISQLTYEITITTFTYSQSPADRPDLEVKWGDNTTSIVQRVVKTSLGDNYNKNVYIGEHTYPGSGTYEIIVEDPNRNYGVENIPNSVNVVFSIKTVMLINSEVGYNNTPVLLNPPIDKAAKGKIFIHNPAAYDADGDSLAYRLGICTGENGEDIIGYELPEASNVIFIDSLNGDLIWDSPVEVGIYNVAIVIEEWRNNIKIGKIVRDMQIEVIESDNNPPIIDAFEKFCVVVDSTLIFEVNASDSDNNIITLTGNGGPLYLNDSSAVFEQPKIGQGTVSQTFTWNTNCSHVRRQPYQVVFKAKDDDDEVELVDIENAEILVIAPPIENIQTEATNNAVHLTWDTCSCSQATGYFIYRKQGLANYIPANCITGVPQWTGYERIANVEGFESLNYIDNNDGRGLAQGYVYCYIITAYFDDGAESIASAEVCTELVKGIPVITNVSVRNTDNIEGSMFVAWSKPTDFDTIAAPGPYKYLIYRSEGMWGESLSLIDSLPQINDTIFVDTLINTKEKQYSYKIEFYNDETGNRFLIGTPQVASSMYLKLVSSDNQISLDIDKNVPWLNDTFIVFRQNALIMEFDSIGITSTLPYVDTGLKNGATYCYKIESLGRYITDGFIDPIINFSQYTCGSPLDNVSPCSPNLILTSLCDSLKNALTWNNLNDSCADDVLKYNIYYSSSISGELELIATLNNANDTAYIHVPEESMAGCYLVTGVDSVGNESSKLSRTCIDNCSYYDLPNVFTPNNDGQNDFFIPGPYNFVEKIDIEIYDRWGVLMFKTQDPDINWDGRNMETKKIVPDGVYYYVCDVYEYRLTGLEPRTILGFVHVLSGKQINAE